MEEISISYAAAMLVSGRLVYVSSMSCSVNLYKEIPKFSEY